MNIRVYVANLGAYNEGELIGKWVALPMDEDELREEIESIMRPETDDEEYAIHDYEAPFKIEENVDLFKLNEQVEELESMRLEEDELEALLEIMSLDGEESFEDGRIHFHHVKSDTPVGWKEFGEYMVWDCGYMDVPEHLRFYIDFEQVGRDLEYSGCYHIAKNGIVIEMRY